MASVRSGKWYFDYISPFAYFHFKRLQSKKLPLEFEPVPVLFAGLLKAWGTKGPAEVSSKRVWTYRYCTWLAQHHGIPFRFPSVHPFHPLRALRLTIALGSTREVVDKIFDVIWKDGLDLNADDGWQRVQAQLEIDNADALVAQSSVKEALAANTSAAASAGVFGVPTLLLDGELFWGNDSVDMLEDFIANADLFRSSEMLRVSNLPVGAARR